MKTKLLKSRCSKCGREIGARFKVTEDGRIGKFVSSWRNTSEVEPRKRFKISEGLHKGKRGRLIFCLFCANNEIFPFEGIPAFF